MRDEQGIACEEGAKKLVKLLEIEGKLYVESMTTDPLWTQQG